MEWLLGLLPKVVANFLARVFKDWRRDQVLKEAGRTERDLEVQKETTEVLARTTAAGNQVDQMTDQEVDEKFDKL